MIPQVERVESRVVFDGSYQLLSDGTLRVVIEEPTAYINFDTDTVYVISSGYEIVVPEGQIDSERQYYNAIVATIKRSEVKKLDIIFNTFPSRSEFGDDDLGPGPSFNVNSPVPCTYSGSDQRIAFSFGSGQDDLTHLDFNHTLADKPGGSILYDYRDRSRSVSINASNTFFGRSAVGVSIHGSAFGDRIKLSDVANSTTVYGEGGADSIVGGLGNDIIDGGLGADVMSGGRGFDTATYATRTDAVNLSPDGMANDGEAGEGDLIGSGFETLVGGAGNDTLAGSNADDVLIGGAGNDKLYGGAGNDKIFGGAGRDTLIGGAGNDRMNGQSGSDMYYANDNEADILTDIVGGTNRASADSKDRLINVVAI